MSALGMQTPLNRQDMRARSKVFNTVTCNGDTRARRAPLPGGRVSDITLIRSARTRAYLPRGCYCMRCQPSTKGPGERTPTVSRRLLRPQNDVEYYCTRSDSEERHYNAGDNISISATQSVHSLRKTTVS
jgi:hypothetical protein